MVVAIDGPAGVGKSTLARHLAHRWRLHYLNTGRYYRVVTLFALEMGTLGSHTRKEDGLTQKTKDLLVKTAADVKWGFDPEHIQANGRTLSDILHSVAVDTWVATVSEIPQLRHILNQQFRDLAREHDLVCEGRDVTSAVFPHAEVRIFLDAEPRIRAQRRFDERSEGMSFEAILESIEARDHIDRNKPIGALKLTSGTILLDSSRLTIEAVCEKVDSIVREHRQ